MISDRKKKIMHFIRLVAHISSLKLEINWNATSHIGGKRFIGSFKYKQKLQNKA